MIIKTSVPIAFAIILGALSSLPAQDAAQSTVNLPSPLPKSATPPPLPSPESAAPVPLPSPSPQSGTPVPLPSPLPTVPELSRLDEAFKQTSIGKEADDNRRRVEIRQLQNRVVNDPAVVEAKHEADVARTDLGKRERLRDYYNIYFDELRRLASGDETKKAVDEMKADHLKLLAQPRVRPVPGATLPPVNNKENKKAKAKKSRFGASGG